MKLITKSTIYSILGFILGLILFFLILRFYAATDTKKMVVSFIALFTTIILFNRTSDYFMKKQIDTSSNPRREYWRLFVNNQIGLSQLNNIPDFNETIDKFDNEYYFYDKGNSRKIRFNINKEGVRFQNIFGKFTSYKFQEITQIFIQHRILTDPDTPNISLIDIIMKIGDTKTDVCDIRKINCNIDELEQIIRNFARDKFKSSTTGNNAYSK